MRDVALTLIIICLLVQSVRRADYGVYLWAWLSLMNPHRMTYGFAFDLPWSQMAAVAGLVGLLLSKQKSLPRSGGVAILALLWAWMTLTSVTSINPADLVWERWIFVSKIIVMFFVAMMVLRGRQHIMVLVAVVTFSVGFFGFKGGIFTILSGGNYRVWGPPDSMMEENNALAVSLVTILPLVYYLWYTASNKWVRRAMPVVMLCIGASIFGSQSRGALLAMLAMSVFLGLKSKYPLRFSLLLVVAIALAFSFMPESWHERMSTIQNNADDTSAQTRIYAWHTMWNVALDRPLVGAGFEANNLSIFTLYAPSDPSFAGSHGVGWTAHSIYFQALGEHGFVGLLIYLCMWLWVWWTASRVAKQAQSLPDLQPWVPLLMRMCQVSTIGFCVGGAFLSLMNLDLPYYIVIFVVLAQNEVKEHLARQRTAAVAKPNSMASAVPSHP